VKLTPAGRELYDRFMPVAAYYEEVATARPVAQGRAALKATLASLYDNLDRLEAEVESGDVAQLIKPERPTSERAPGKRPSPKMMRGRPAKERHVRPANSHCRRRHSAVWRQHSRSRDIDFRSPFLNGPPTIRKLAPAFSSVRTRSTPSIA